MTNVHISSWRHRQSAMVATAVTGAILLCSWPASAQSIATEVINGHKAAAREVLIGFTVQPSAVELQQMLTSADADAGPQVVPLVHRIHSRSLAVPQLLNALGNFPNVKYVEPNYLISASATGTDTRFTEQWGLNNTGQTVNSVSSFAGADIKAVNAWQMSKGSTANVIVVLDSGVEYSHADLAGNIWSSATSFTVNLNGVSVSCGSGTRGFNALTNACDPKDDFGHGTHMAGIIGAVGNNALGVSGVNQITRIMSIKVLGSTGTGTVADAVEGIEFAIQTKLAFASTNGANVRVLSASWGGGPSSQALSDEIGKANTNNMLFVASAGNGGVNTDAVPYYPAGYAQPNIIAVGATDSFDYLTSFSNHGGTSVDVGAPGNNILSTGMNGTYVFSNGASQATAFVSGAATLVLSGCGTLTAASLRSTLLNNVTVLSSLNGLVATSGRLNVDKAIRACFVAKPAAPTNLIAKAGDANAVLTWTASTGATSYNIKKATTSSGPWTTFGSATGTGVTVTGLANGTVYYFVVSAVNAGGESANSTYKSAKPLAAPGAPTGLTATGQAGQIYLVWKAATGTFSGYNVKRGTVSGGPYSQIATATKTSYYNKSLVKGTTYCYVVAAYNVNGTQSPASNQACATVQ